MELEERRSKSASQAIQISIMKTRGKKMLVEWECGCVGVVNENDETACSYLVIKVCRRIDQVNGSPFTIKKSLDVQDRVYRPLDSLEILELFEEMTDIVADGNALRGIRMAFSTAGLR
jgi:hypothetical protein